MTGEKKDVFVSDLLHVYLNHMLPTVRFLCEIISLITVCFPGT